MTDSNKRKDAPGDIKGNYGGKRSKVRTFTDL
jgi:hypothetical protein